MAPNRPVVHVAGRGAVSAFGVGHDTLIEAIFAGHSGVRPLERLAGTDCLTEVAAEVPKDLLATVDSAEDLPFVMARLAAEEAITEGANNAGDNNAGDNNAGDNNAGDDNAGDDNQAKTPVDERTMLVLASTKADMRGITTPSGDGMGSPARLAHRLAEALSIRGQVLAVSCACASGLSALAIAARKLRAGAATRALVVGTDALRPFILRGFSSLLALDPGPCRPFDAERRGLNVGEGAGAILLSTEEGESLGFCLAGHGESNDANHITGPSRDGLGLSLAIDRALDDASLRPGSVDFVHLHGTGTPYNDAMENQALRRAFARAAIPPAAGSKAQLGHTLGAAGILESLIALSTLERRSTPPNLGLHRTDEDCAIALQPGPAELSSADSALKIAAGFGGINAAVVFRRVAAS